MVALNNLADHLSNFQWAENFIGIYRETNGKKNNYLQLIAQTNVH